MKQKRYLQKALFGFFVLLLFGVLSFCAFGASSAAKVSLSLNNVTESSAVLNWKSEGKADGYLIYRYDYAAKSFDRVAVTSKTTFTFRKLQGGESYCFGVRAYLENGKTLEKGKLAKVKCYTPLSAVTVIKQTQTTATSHKLQWKAVSGADTYQIYYFMDSTKSFSLLGTTEHPYCTVKKLKPASVSQYKVRPVSLCANGKTVKAKTSEIFYAYTNPGDIERFTAEDVTSTGYRLVWDAVPGADGYRIFRYNAKQGKYKRLTEVQTTSCTVENLAPCSTEFYKICAYKELLGKVRYGARTAALSLTTKPETVTPVLLARPAANGVIKVGWNKGVCDGYLVFGAEREEGPYQLLEQVDSPDTLSCAIRSPFDSEILYVRVKTYVTVDGNAILSPYSDAILID